MSSDIDTAERQEGGDVDDRRSWLDARMDGRTLRSWMVVGLVIAAVTLGFGAYWTYGLGRGGQMAGGQANGAMGAAMSPDAPRVPAVFAYYGGQPIAFIHTEASDATITELLAGMMGSPVPVVASLITVAEDDARVTLKATDVVVNAPLLTWPGGQR